MRDSDPAKETVLLHGISPQLEKELMRRAREHGRDTSAEASEIIERHLEDDMKDES